MSVSFVVAARFPGRATTIGSAAGRVKGQCAESGAFPRGAVECRPLPCVGGTLQSRAAIRQSAMAPSTDGAPPPTATPQDRLDSWKEIASHLNRDVTTVQRWEKREGMPVHRHLHGRMGSVYAHRADLDAWACTRNADAMLDGANIAVVPDTAVQPLR